MYLMNFEKEFPRNILHQGENLFLSGGIHKLSGEHGYFEAEFRMGRWLGFSDIVINDSLDIGQYHCCCLESQPCAHFAAILYALRFMYSVGEADFQSAKVKYLSSNKSLIIDKPEIK